MRAAQSGDGDGRQAGGKMPDGERAHLDQMCVTSPESPELKMASRPTRRDVPARMLVCYIRRAELPGVSGTSWPTKNEFLLTCAAAVGIRAAGFASSVDRRASGGDVAEVSAAGLDTGLARNLGELEADADARTDRVRAWRRTLPMGIQRSTG